jgi:hypothetical protein
MPKQLRYKAKSAARSATQCRSNPVSGRAIQVKLDEIGNDFPEHADFVSQMRSLIDRFDLDQYMATLKTLHSYDH